MISIRPPLLRNTTMIGLLETSGLTGRQTHIQTAQCAPAADEAMTAISFSLLPMFTLSGNLTLRQIISTLLPCLGREANRKWVENSPVVYQQCATHIHQKNHPIWMSTHTHTHLHRERVVSFAPEKKSS